MNEHNQIISPILAALIVAILPHIVRLPLWIIFWCASMWGYLILSLKFNWPRPGKAILHTLAVAGIAGLVVTYSRHLEQNAYLGLLAVMSALKPFEMNSHRDRMITVFLAYFIVITSLFLSETLAITLYMLLSVCVTTATLIRINDPFGRFQDNLKLSALMVAQAIPLMILLFFLFPRIQGSLLGFSGIGGAKSGFSGSLAPGSVANLSKNNDVVFRAMFKDRIPPSSQLYWRGIVFQTFDGRQWHAAGQPQEYHILPKGRHLVSYTVSLEPHHQRWLFALDMPAIIPPAARLYQDYTLRARRQVDRKFRYDMASNTRYRAEMESWRNLRRLTLLPESVNPKTRRLAAQITKNTRKIDEKVIRILDYFQTGGFSYTLQAPRLGRNSVDDFIFKSRKGYCEHYASAFAFMLRSVGIPARIVGGYLGGEVNPYANYLIVRQSDAHVWVEAWLPEKRWTRFDPTAVVAPDRISEGRQDALTDSSVWQNFGLLKKLRFGWDAVSTRWSALFEGYSYYEQKTLLNKIGITSGVWDASIKALLLLLVLAGIIVGVYAGLALKSSRSKPDAVKKYYVRFCKKLAQAGFERKPEQGPVDYGKYVSKNRPDLKNRIDEITELYVQLRYRRKAPKDVTSEFTRKVKLFDPVLK